MKTWKAFANTETIAWLLEEQNPAVRAQTLADLFDYAPDSPEVVRARAAEMENGLSGRVLAGMQPGGWWGKPEDFYMRSKYVGTVWSFLLLSEMGCAFQDERYLRAAEFLLSHAQRPDNGGFTYATPRPAPRPAAIPCLTGNLAWAILQTDLAGDSRMGRALAWLSANQHLRDGPGDPAPAGVTADTEKSLFENCWGSHTCLTGVVKGLKALQAWPDQERSPEMKLAIREGVEFLLRHRLIFRSHALDQLSHPDFARPGFPLLWRTDVVEMLEVLLRLGVSDEALRPALDLLQTRQRPDGRWALEQSFNGRMLVRVEKDGQPSKWITLRALRILKMAGEARILS